MLPLELSTDICSLPGRLTLVLSCILWKSSQGEVAFYGAGGGVFAPPSA